MQKQNTACIGCSKPLVEGGEFCPFCGISCAPVHGETRGVHANREVREWRRSVFLNRIRYSVQRPSLDALHTRPQARNAFATLPDAEHPERVVIEYSPLC